jgi:hypothetical protein
MARYLTKKRRNIKKYKKSRKGHRRGGRSIKRHTVGKRRRMVGGDDVFNFNINSEDLKYVMSRNQRYPVLLGVNKVEFVAYGIALVTNRSIGKLLRTDNRKEQINVFACYLQENTNEPDCYAILRCADTFCFDYGNHSVVTPNFHMDDKILFLFVKDQQTSIETASNNTKKLAGEMVKGISYNVFQFNNRISSDDLYKILVPPVEPHNANLNAFFDTVANKNDLLEKKEYYEDLGSEISRANIQKLENRKPGSGSGAQDAAGLGFSLFLGL